MPLIEFGEGKEITQSTKYVGGLTFDTVAGKRLTIETSPMGKDILDAEVPAGKAWKVHLHIEVVETNV